MNPVRRLVDELVKEYRTNDPFELADFLNIAVRYADTDDDFKGVYIPVNGQKLIILNNKYKHSRERYFYMAHELLHAIKHSDQVHYYHNGYYIKQKQEREAHMFATNLLLNDKTVRNGQTIQKLLSENYIPIEMDRYL